MVPFRRISGLAQVRVHFVFVLFFSFAFAALQNVTVDDAVLTGPAAPHYLPNASSWNIGNDCSACLAKPNPALAYNGTWHDATLFPGDNVSQTIEFSFTGNALYVFFILANNLTGVDTKTDLTFVLDDVAVSTYTHSPTATSDFEYNVPVYANASLDYGTHALSVQPANSGSPVLMLFDYLVYTTDTSTSGPASPSGTATSSPAASASAGNQMTISSSSRPNVAAIAGGAVGAVVAVLLVAAALIWYRRYKRRTGDRPLSEDGLVASPFVFSREIGPDMTSLAGLGAPSQTRWTGQPTFLDPFSEPTVMSRNRLGRGMSVPMFSATSQALSSTVTAPSNVPSRSRSSDDADLIGQVELLRTEVARLCRLHEPDPNTTSHRRSEAPPQYS